jgi:hypothetical protein
VADCVVPVYAIVRVGSWVVWLGGCRHGGSKRPVDSAVMLRVGQRNSRRGTVVLGVVLLLLLLRRVGVATVVDARCGRGWSLRDLRGAGASYEQLVILALRIAVASSWRVSVACSSSICLVSTICAGRPAMVWVLILARCTAIAGVGYAGVVVILPVPVVRHGAVAGWGAIGRREVWRLQSESSFTRLPGEVARAA